MQTMIQIPVKAGWIILSKCDFWIDFTWNRIVVNNSILSKTTQPTKVYLTFIWLNVFMYVNAALLWKSSVR